MKHITSLLLLLGSTTHDVEAVPLIPNDCKKLKKNTETLCPELCTTSNCQTYYCCKGNDAACDGFDRDLFCAGVDLENDYPFACGTTCDWGNEACCTLGTSPNPTPPPTTPAPNVAKKGDSGAPCICSPQTYSLRVNNYDTQGPQVNLNELCTQASNPLTQNAGIKLNSIVCEICVDESKLGKCADNKPSDVTNIIWTGAEVEECGNVKKVGQDVETCGKKDIVGGQFEVGKLLQIESVISTNLDPSLCASEQKKAPLGVSVTLTGFYIGDNSLGNIGITLAWAYTNECAVKPFETNVKFWESFFGYPLLEIGSFVGPDESLFCNDDGCPNILGGPAAEEDRGPASSPVINAAKSAVEEAPALENPNSSLDMTTGVAWGIVTATMMLFIMG